MQDHEKGDKRTKQKKYKNLEKSIFSILKAINHLILGGHSTENSWKNTVISEGAR